ncbi:MAG: 3-hydroxybutyryl-CoA dehydrogenase [Bdellovibrionales bacterium]|nr:3-hydroxybutyryl-CoA dehydrogenase [Bdellovibrionales bacterium]
MSRIGGGSVVGVVGAGTMGSGIAQVAAQAGHQVVVFDTREDVVNKLKPGLERVFNRLVEKGKVSKDDAMRTLERVQPTASLDDFAPASFVIEAVVEDLAVKQTLFGKLERICGPETILATNTSSLPVTAIQASCARPEHVLGVHFFNPAPLLPLVEIIPGLRTDSALAADVASRISAWGKTTVLARDLPGFIVNRIARPFYGEALRILEEGIADVATIDWAMKELGGFRMGPFELMDLIGNDINVTVSETVFQAFYFDPRYRPSLLQRRYVDAGWLGKKTGRGWYDYSEGANNPAPTTDQNLGARIVDRIVVMLMNEALDALYLGVASAEDIDLAMTKGVNYPKGLLRWAEERGFAWVLEHLTALRMTYNEDRYRPSPILRRLVQDEGVIFGTAA